MKRHFSPILCAALLGISLTSCEKIDNGNLDGFWHLTQADTLSTGQSSDMTQSGVFWSVQGNVFQTSIPTLVKTYIYSFSYSDNKLVISNPFENYRLEGDIQITDSTLYQLRPMGVNALQEQFDVIKLTRRTMVVESSMLRLHFEKF